MKVCFVLDREADDWPPVRTENLWARPLGSDEYELENIPWFAKGVAFGDRVRATRDAAGVLTVTECVEWSGRYTIRLIPLGDRPAEDELQGIVDAFSPLGAECEGALPAFKLIALDIPSTAEVSEIKRLLVEGEAQGRWGYEEGRIDNRWRDL